MKFSTSISLLGLSSIASLLFAAIPAFAAQVCTPTDQSMEEVFPGVTLTWNSSFHCLDAPNSDDYMITVDVSNAGTSLEAVTIDGLVLSHTTPRPRGRVPAGSAETVGLPITVGPGETAGFAAMGEYQLVETDEGLKVNLHLRAEGAGADTFEPFELGINVHLRGPGATE